MEIILIVLAVLILAFIFFLLFLKNKQKALDTTPVAAPVIERTADRNVQTPDLSPESLSADTLQSAPSIVANPLDKAEALINDQRYDDATHELKRLLMSNPQNTNAMLKLLQVYGITNNHNAFNQLHQKIHELGDSDTIKQADFCRSLLEDDLTTSTAVNTPSPTPKEATQIDSLDFDIESADNQNAAPLASTPEQTLSDTEESLILDESFDLTFDEPSIHSNTPTEPIADLDFSSAEDILADTQLHSEDDVGFDFDFDDVSDNQKDLNISDSPSEEPTQTLDDDFSLDFETDDAQQLAQNLTSTASDDIDEFDLGEFDLDLSEPSQPINEPQPADLSYDSTSYDNALDLDDSLDVSTELNSTPLAEPSASEQATTQLTDDTLGLDTFDFDLSDTPSPAINDASDLALSLDSPASATTQDDFVFEETTILAAADDDLLANNDLIIDDGLVAEDSLVIEDTLVADDSLAVNVDDSNESTHNADAFNADEFSFDLNESPVSESSDVTSAKDISMDFDFDFNETTPSNGVISTQKAEQSFDFTDNSLLGDDDLAEPVAPSVNQPIKDDLTFDLNEQAFDDDLSFAQPKSVETDNMPTATSAPASKLADDLSFVGASDGAQVTLDLAARYLNLGEHDSARRLLEEVMQSGNVTQQKTASDLLARL